jgi:GNAT superfamily N-acetyltransferase
MTFQIRRATEADALGAVKTLRRSITELCTADHHGDATRLASWLANKTVESWKTWVASKGTIAFVADRNSEVVGVGMANLQGDILLNYVHPDARFTGVSKALLAALEVEMRLHKVTHCRIKSTVTACRFYESCGYRPEIDDALHLSKSL